MSNLVGIKVQARWGAEGKLYGATIVAVNADGTVKLEWEAKSSTGKTLVTSKARLGTAHPRSTSRRRGRTLCARACSRLTPALVHDPTTI